MAARWHGVLLAALVIAGCGDDDAGAGDRPDANVTVDVDASSGTDAAPQAPACVEADAPADACGGACGEGEKCTWIVRQASPSFLGETACVRDGTIPVCGACEDTCIEEGSSEAGEPCAGPDPEAEPAIIMTDNCASGSLCTNGLCKPICQQGEDGCGDDAACVAYGDMFTDLEGIGVCSPTCDPLGQNCAEGLGCYIDPFPGAGYATCESELNPERTQGEPCPSGDCSLNGCAAGYGPWLQDDDGNVFCTAFSGVVDTYIDDTQAGDGYGDGVGPLVGSPVGLDPDCSAGRIGVADHNSFFLQSFYGNTGDTPDTWGICAPAGLEHGDCSQLSVERLFRTYDEAEMAEPGTGSAALMALCEAEPVCGFSCVRDATYMMRADAYCAAHEGAPACVSAVTGSLIRTIVLAGGRSIRTDAMQAHPR